MWLNKQSFSSNDQSSSLNRKKLSGLVILLILVAAIPVGVYLAMNPQTFSPKAAVDSTVDLRLLPSVISVNVNEEFPVDISIDSKGALVSAAEIKLNYNTEHLEAKNVEIKDFLPQSLISPNISNGSINIVQVVNPDNSKSGIGTIARITFRALKVVTGSAINFDPGLTEVAISDRDNNAVGSLGNAVVNINCPAVATPVITSPQNILTGNQPVTWNSAGAAKYFVEIDDLKNTLNCAAGSDDFCQEVQSSSVNFAFKKGHKYQIKVRAENNCGSAQAAKRVLWPFDGDITRKVGVEEINGRDGVVDIYDYNLVVTDFKKTGQNLIADINKNGRVDIFDFNFVVRDFRKSFTNP